MVKKVLKRKVSSEVAPKEPEVEEVQTADARPKRKCLFCQGKTSPSYTDVAILRRFQNDRGRITPKLRSGLCSKHQRILTRQIKYARHLALLPFTPKV